MRHHGLLHHHHRSPWIVVRRVELAIITGAVLLLVWDIALKIIVAVR